MPESPLTFSFQDIRSKLFQALECAQATVQANSFAPTSLGISLDGYLGDVSFAFNLDDDESYQCEEIASFTGPSSKGFTIPEVEFLDEYEEVLVDRDGAATLQTVDDGYNALYRFLVDETKNFFKTCSDACWRPSLLVFGEYPRIGDNDAFPCPEGPELPPRPRLEPWTVLGFDQEPKGTRVYQLSGHERKYARLYCEDRNRGKFDGVPVKASWPEQVSVKTFGGGISRRLGCLAESDLKGAFGLFRGAPQYEVMKDLLENQAEFLPVREDDREWDLVHLLSCKQLLNSDKSHFGYLMKEIVWSINRHEFDRGKLADVGNELFKLSELPTAGPYFIERDGVAGFRNFCEAHEIRGISAHLVWSDDLTFLLEKLRKFTELVDLRLERIMGSTNVKVLDIECLDATQVALWQLGKKSEEPENIVGWEGYLCSKLPRAISSLVRMERSGDGMLAVYGPTV